MVWALRFHSAVPNDLSDLDKANQQAVLKAIRKKLTIAPEGYGEPLRKELFGLWKLRVGEVRVIYRIEKTLVAVFILKVGFRRDSAVYEKVLQRLRRS